ncbi:MAG: transglutaminase domain-containing protein, partial [Desulfofustis sp.]|nr:transglutaminase domain-containing protein [Desulfofustis sp.]
MSRRPAIKAMPLIKGVVCVLWLLLFALLLHRDSFVKTINSRESVVLEQARRTEYQGIYFKDKKIGYVQHHGAPADGNTVIVSQRAVMDLNISGQSHPIDLDLRATIDQNSRLQDFHFNFSSPFYHMEATGTVTGSTVSFTLDTGNSIIKDQIVLSDPPLLPTSRRAYLLSQELTIGEKLRVPWFDPLSLTAKTSLVEYRGREKTLIHQRVYLLHRFTELFAGVRVNVWLDDEGVVVKEESPAGFVFIR